MLRSIIPGDITDPRNKSDIVIGMNSELSDVTGIGLPFVKNVIPQRLIQLGSVLTYQFDHGRRLHMLICHHLGKGGWSDAHKHVRFGLDYLNYINEMEEEEGRVENFSIVQIGTGRVGKRDGADHSAIKLAIAASHLMVDMFIYEPPGLAATVADVVPLQPLAAWHPMEGSEEFEIRVAA